MISAHMYSELKPYEIIGVVVFASVVFWGIYHPVRGSAAEGMVPRSGTSIVLILVFLAMIYTILGGKW